MIALLALLALFAGPIMVIVPCQRAGRRARTVGLPVTRTIVRDGEAWTVVAGLLLIVAAVVALAVLAVLG